MLTERMTTAQLTGLTGRAPVTGGIVRFPLGYVDFEVRRDGNGVEAHGRKPE